MIPLDSRMSPDLLRGMGKLIGGDLDVDDEGSEQRRFEPVQLLHHGSVGYQPMHTRIGLAKKTMSLQGNREHKQEQERTILNCRCSFGSARARPRRRRISPLPATTQHLEMPPPCRYSPPPSIPPLTPHYAASPSMALRPIPPAVSLPPPAAPLLPAPIKG
jgi:hypothetical protein